MRSQFDALLFDHCSSKDEAAASDAGDPAAGMPPSEQHWHVDSCRGLDPQSPGLPVVTGLEGRASQACVRESQEHSSGSPCLPLRQPVRQHDSLTGHVSRRLARLGTQAGIRKVGWDQEGDSIGVLTEASWRLQAQQQGGCQAGPCRTTAPPAW